MEDESPRITYTAHELRKMRADIALPDESPLIQLYGNIITTSEKTGLVVHGTSRSSASSQQKKATPVDDGNWRSKGKPEFTKPPATVKRNENSVGKAAASRSREPRQKDSLWDDAPSVRKTSRAEQERLLFEQERAEFLANRVYASAPVVDETDVVLEEERGSSLLQLRDEDAAPPSNQGGMKSMTVSQLLRRHSQNKDAPPPPPEVPYPPLDLAMLRHPPEINDESDMKWLSDILDMPHDMPIHESPRSGRREKSLLSHLSSDEPLAIPDPSTPPSSTRHFPTNSSSDALTSLLGLGGAKSSPGRDTGTRVAVSSLFSAASAHGGVMASQDAASAPVIVNHTDVLSVLGFNAPPSPPRKDPPPAAASPSFVFHKSAGGASPAMDGSVKKPAISAASRLHIQRILQSSEKKRTGCEGKSGKPSPVSASKSAQLASAVSANLKNPPTNTSTITISSAPPPTAAPSNTAAPKPGMKKINLNSIFSAAASAPNKTLQVGK